MFSKVKPSNVIYLKLGDRFVTSLTMLGLAAKGSISSIIKENLLLYCRKFSALLVAVII